MMTNTEPLRPTTEDSQLPQRSRSSHPFVELLRICAPILILMGSVFLCMTFVHMQVTPHQVTPEELVPLVATTTVEPSNQGVEIHTDGIVVPYREINIAAQVGGRITEKSELCRAGRYVKQGTKLVQIDPTDYQLSIDQLEKEVEQSANALDESLTSEKNLLRLIELSKQDLELQEKNLHRMEELVPSRSVTQEEVETVQRSHVTAQTSLVSLENELATLRQKRVSLQTTKDKNEVLLRQAAVDLERTTITAPVDGIVVSDAVEVDSYVSPGTALFTLEDATRVEVRAHLKASEIDWLWQAQVNPPEDLLSLPYYDVPKVPVLISYTLAGHTYHWDGILSRYDGSGLDPTTRTIPCRILVPDPRKLVSEADAMISGTNFQPRERPAMDENVTNSVELEDALVRLNRERNAAQKTSNTQNDTNPSPQTLASLDCSASNATGSDSNNSPMPKGTAVVRRIGRSGPPALLRGMYVKVTVCVPSHAQLLSVPEGAIQPGNQILRVVDGKIDIQPVTIVERNAGTAIVVSQHELSAGDHVIISPVSFAKQGVAVREQTNVADNHPATNSSLGTF